jgi:hypothetical protein
MSLKEILDTYNITYQQIAATTQRLRGEAVSASTLTQMCRYGQHVGKGTIQILADALVLLHAPSAVVDSWLKEQYGE